MEKQISSQTVFQGKIITVYHDEVECQNGLMAKREIVRHHGGVGILAIIDNHIILVKQYRYAYGEETIEIPAGKLEANEASDLAGQRELEEETGYSCQRLVPVTNIYPTPGYCDEVIHLYQAEELYQKENQELIGCCCLGIYYSITGKKACLEDVVVLPEFQGKGGGFMLVSHATAEAEKLQVEQMLFTSKPSRIKANNLYRKMGFSQKETNVYLKKW